MHVSTAHAIGCAILQTPTVIDFVIRKGCDIVSNRTYLAKRAIELGATHLFFVDSDMFFSPDTINKMLAHKKDIVACDYNKRKFPLESVTTQLEASEKNEENLYRVAAAATGCMLIDLRVFTEGKLASPWFNFGRNAEGELSLGEDSWFCYTARDAGYEVWIDPTIKVLHIGEYTF